MRGNIAIGLDVGTTKVCALVAELKPGGVKVLGAGLAPSIGLRKGIVINIDATVDSIRKAVREAESSSGVKIKSVSVGISGAHIRGIQSTGAVGVGRSEVTALDVERAVDSAKAVYIPLDRDVLHVIPQEFVLDGQDGISDPLGMSGVRLEARVHILTGAASSIQNLMRCCERAGLEVADVVFEPLASAHAVLTPDEMRFGAVVVDIGGGTTDIALFKEGRLKYGAALAVGGDHITNDIAVGLRVGVPEAERLKKEYGAAFAGAVEGSEEIRILHSGDQEKQLPRKYLVEIIQPRCEELLEMIKDEVRNCRGYEEAVCGVVLTGGVPLLRGFDRISEVVLGMPVRIGAPPVQGLPPVAEAPQLATAMGLITYDYVPGVPETAGPEATSGFFRSITDRIKGLIGNMNPNIEARKEGGILCLKSKR